MTEYATADVKGRGVIDSKGITIGDVKDIMIDPDNWTVQGIVVSVTKEVADDLHLERRTFGGSELSVSPERVQAFGENVILNVDTDALAGLLRQSQRD